MGNIASSTKHSFESKPEAKDEATISMSLSSSKNSLSMRSWIEPPEMITTRFDLREPFFLLLAMVKHNNDPALRDWLQVRISWMMRA
jgi:hypothetical protein